MTEPHHVRRALARTLFDTPEYLLVPGLRLDSASVEAMQAVRQRFVRDRHGPMSGECGGTDEEDIRTITDEARSVRRVLQAICTDDPRTGEERSVASFLRQWHVFRGYDIDGLISIGEGRCAGSDDLPARFRLAEHYERALGLATDGAERGRLPDEHVHYGQLMDANILWLTQMSSDALLPVHSLATTMNENYQTVALMKDQHWNARFQCARFLLVNALLARHLGMAEHPLRDSVETIKGICHDRYPADRVSSIADRAIAGGPFERHSRENAVATEYWLFSAIGDRDAEPSRVEAACAYVLLKNAFLNNVAQNAVRDFEQFSASLQSLDVMYEAMSTDLGKGTTVGFVRAMLDQGSRKGGPVRLRFNPAIGGNPHASQARDLREASWRLHMLRRTAVLAVKRDDIERMDAVDIDRAVDKLVEAARVLRDEEVAVVGVDVIGPEVRQRDLTPRDRRGGVAIDHVKSPVGFAFALRRKLETLLGTKPFATFHCGEHCGNSILSILGMAYVVSHPSFDRALDRISHALVLHEQARHLTFLVDQRTTDAVSLIAKAVIENLDTARSLPKATISVMRRTVLKLEKAVAGQGAPPEFFELQRALLALATENHIKIEVCPASNAMIRRDLVNDVADHPWSCLYGKPNLLVGTDDPSLNQTLPWMEHAFLDHAARG